MQLQVCSGRPLTRCCMRMFRFNSDEGLGLSRPLTRDRWAPLTATVHMSGGWACHTLAYLEALWLPFYSLRSMNLHGS
eukprot:scaffold238881_cov18-Tisochrysis_lutea.AAC.1